MRGGQKHKLLGCFCSWEIIKFLQKALLRQISLIVLQTLDYLLIKCLYSFEGLTIIIVTMIRAGRLTLSFKSSTKNQIGQQQNNVKRFYKEAYLGSNPNPKHPLHKYLLLLDGRTIKTPYQNQLAFPSQKLGFLVASEFNRQHKYLKTGQMPFLGLSRTAVDADIEGHLSPHLRHSIIQYLKTDTLLFEDDRYEKEYEQLVRPLISFVSKKFDMKLKPSDSIAPPEVEINQKFEEWLDSLNCWQLIGLETMTIWMKSTIAGISVAESSFKAEDIQRAAYLEEHVQMRGSGEVEEKLMDINQIRLMVSCGQIFYRFGKLD